ncbi:MAG: hypothetical protein HRU08_03140 [Oleispira sp.]|jgi:hypothetical protein|nr:hypothetical protein [Oleispira sp.]
MNPVRFLVLTLIYGFLAACDSKEPYNLQGKAGDIGDSMEHCRAFLKHLLPSDAYVYIDSASSRETVEYFDIFLDIQDNEQEGHAQCRVNKRGLITHHSIRDFRQKRRSFQ